jgi:putative oxidoreductase
MDISLLIVRLVIGLFVAGHGAQKLFGWFGGHGLKGTAGWLGSIGLRPAGAWAFLAGLAEFGGGVLFALGLASPMGALGISAAMLVAITRVHWPKVWAAEGGFEHPLINLAVAAAVGIAGPGAFSLDQQFGTALPAPAALVAMVLVVLGWLAVLAMKAARPATASNSPS